LSKDEAKHIGKRYGFARSRNKGELLEDSAGGNAIHRYAADAPPVLTNLRSRLRSRA